MKTFRYVHESIALSVQNTSQLSASVLLAETISNFKHLMAVMLLSLVMLFAGGSEVSAVQLASWTFEGGYDVSGNVNTPNSGTWAEVGATWFAAGAPQILADEAVGTQTDYVVTGKSSRYWQLCSGYNNHVFRIVNDTQANDISSPTDASTRDNYYEV